MASILEGKKEWLQRLRASTLFASIPDDLWSALSPHIEFSNLIEDRVLQPAHTTATRLSGVMQGWLRSYASTPFGEQQFGSLRAGDLFGELAMIDAQEDPAEIRTASPVLLWSIPHDALRAILEKSNVFAALLYQGFWRSLAEKIQRSNEQMKKFFGADTRANPQENAAKKKPPSRPAWFAPPEGIRQTSSGSLPILGRYMRDDEKRKILQDIGLNPSEVEILFAHGEEIALAAGEVIFREGDFGDTLYFVLQGEVRISKYIQGVGEEALAILHPGQFFGEMALVADHAVRSADSYAHESSVLLLALRQHLLHAREGIAEKEPLFLQALCKMMALRLRENYAKLFNWRMMSGGF